MGSHSLGADWQRTPEDFVHKMCFTGTVVGLYATGNGQASRTPARFDWFEYEI
ncbi:beta-xylosidase family glycoside hydrolase [Paenibacillus taichungensis]